MEKLPSAKKKKYLTAQEDILEAAGRVFVEKGYEGSSISDIAEKKNMNQSLIYHYFKNKKALWSATKSFLLKEYIEGSASCIDTSHGLHYFLMKFCRYGFEYLASHPEIVRILNWQRLEDKRHQLIKLKLTGRQGFEEAFIEMQNKGEIQKDLDPHLTTVFIRSLIRAPFFDDFSWISKDPACEQLYLETIVASIEKAIAPH